MGLPCEEWRTEGRSAQIQLELSASAELLAIAAVNFDIELEGIQGKARFTSVTRPHDGAYSEANFEADSSLLSHSISVEADTLNILDNPISNGVCAGILGQILSPLFSLLFGSQCNLDQMLDLHVQLESQEDNLSQEGSMSASLSWPDGPTAVTLNPGFYDTISSSLNRSLGGLNIQIGSVDVDKPGQLLGVVNSIANEILSGIDTLGLDITEALVAEIDAVVTPVLDALGVSTNEVTIELLGMSASPAEVVM